MTRLRLHPEHHLVGRIGWLRAAVLGANDGIVSTASLVVGVAAGGGGGGGGGGRKGEGRKREERMKREEEGQVLGVRGGEEGRRMREWGREGVGGDLGRRRGFCGCGVLFWCCFFVGVLFWCGGWFLAFFLVRGGGGGGGGLWGGGGGGRGEGGGGGGEKGFVERVHCRLRGRADFFCSLSFLQREGGSLRVCVLARGRQCGASVTPCLSKAALGAAKSKKARSHPVATLAGCSRKAP